MSFKTHIDSGERCCVFHFEDLLNKGACIKCGNCGMWIRPYQLNKECKGNINENN
jgi:hypothetical protein